MEKVPYDLIVIGSGPGGYSAAVRAGQYGLKTAHYRKDSQTGRHLPSRRLYSHQSPAAHRGRLGNFAHSDDEGIHCEKPLLNYPKVIERKNEIVQKHAKGVEFLMKKNKVE